MGNQGQPPVASGGKSAAKCTILLVDDDSLISMATSDMLQDLGHSVVEAPSGKQALEILRSGMRVDMVMTDQSMPGMTGVQLAAEIRANWPNLPVMLVTGYSDLPPEADATLPKVEKPYDQERLAAAILSVIGTKPLR